MTGNKNVVILGAFVIFAIGLKAHPVVLKHEIPPPMQPSLYTDSQVAFSQYPNVPMLSLDEMKNAFPWLESAEVTNRYQNEPRYIFYYSPTEVNLNRNDNLETNTANLNFYPMQNYPLVQDQLERNTNLNYDTANANFEPTQNVISLQDQAANILEMLDTKCSKCNNGNFNAVNRYDSIKHNLDVNEGNGSIMAPLNIGSVEQSSMKNNDEASDKVSQPGVDFRRTRTTHKKGRRKDSLEDEDVEFVKHFEEPLNHRRYKSETRRPFRGLKSRHANERKCKTSKKCRESDKTSNNFELSDDRASYKTENEKVTSERTDNSDEEFERHEKAESNHRSIYAYPKKPSLYMQPPKLTTEDLESYSKLKQKPRGKKRKSELSSKDEETNRLKNHRLNNEQDNKKEYKDLGYRENLKNHKMEYVRDHAPENNDEDEETSGSEIDNAKDQHPKKKTIDPFELSPDGERVEFQIHGHEGPKTYIFGFDTGNGKNRHFRLEERLKDGTVKGHYGYYDALGKLKMVQYTARPLGGYEEKHHESSDYKPET